MIESLKIRWLVILVVLVAAIIWLVPNFVNLENRWWFTKNKIVMGLDIQGGSHLVMSVDMDSVMKRDSTRLAKDIEEDLKKEGIAVTGSAVTDHSKAGITLNVADNAAADKASDLIESRYGTMFQVAGKTDQAVQIQFYDVYLKEYQQRLLDQSIETIRNRIDEFGVAEPSITAQGTNRILVQLPGIKDSATAKDLINRTARLDFMMLAEGMEPAKLEELIQTAETEGGFKLGGELTYSKYTDRLNEALKGKIPENTTVYFEKAPNAENLEAGRVPHLLSTTETVAGDTLKDAYVSFGQFGEPEVIFSFTPDGTRRFGELTTKHVQKQMAIVLDKVVKSAPVIKTPITQGTGSIEMGGGRNVNETLSEAKLISMALRSGALPAALEQLEERTVGPSLGADAIEQGRNAALIGCAIVFVFMVVYYRTFGVIANLALAFNVVLTMALLSSLGATLTLPGIAGLALTVGMAVDANVIIYERIKEELSKGASLMAAVREGYDKAFSSIFDANVTTAAVCVILIYYGTGPIRGFAVTLLLGLTTSMFTSIFFTRAIFDFFVGKRKMSMSIPGVHRPVVATAGGN